MGYLEEKQKKVAPPTLWSIASMLKKTLLTYHNVNIGEYGKVTPFLKQNQVRYKPKKVKIFTKEQINTFLLTAPDDDFLMKKVCFEIYFQLLTLFQGCHYSWNCWCLSLGGTYQAQMQQYCVHRQLSYCDNSRDKN